MKQLELLNLDDLVVIDIETVRIVDEIDMDSPMGEAWEYKMRHEVDDIAKLPELFKEKAALYSEFGKVVCITVGRINGTGDIITVKSYSSNDEKALLTEFNSDLEKVVSSRPKTRLAGHAIIGFDIPYIFRRSIVNGVKPTSLVDVGGLKPWEVTHLDTMVLWKGTGYNNSSLLSLCVAFGIPSPKSDINGADVSNVYYNSEVPGGLKRITEYCEGDVIATANVLLKMMLRDTATEVVRIATVEVIPVPLIERIKGSGTIDKSIEKEILSVVKDFNGEEKTKAIEVINAALSFNKGELSAELKAKILK